MTLIPPYVRSRVAVPEMDLSGTVLDVWHPDATADPGKPHTRFSKGDKVVAMLPAAHTIPTGNGALAEYVRLPARYAVPKPEGIGFADAAGVMLAGLTARQLVMESGVTTGDRVLVNAASGGIGHLVIQMLRNTVGSDGFIVAICGASKADMMKSLGADEVSYSRNPLTPRSSTTQHTQIFPDTCACGLAMLHSMQSLTSAVTKRCTRHRLASWLQTVSTSQSGSSHRRSSCRTFYEPCWL